VDNFEVLQKECAQYFKSNAGFKRTFEKIREKYESLGNIGGTVVLSNLKAEEKEALTGLFRKDYNKKNVSFKVENFIKALESTKFSGVDFEKVLEIYFGEKLLSRKEEKTIYEVKKSIFFKSIIVSFIDTKGEKWLRYVLESKENAYRIISQRYDEAKDTLRKNLLWVCTAYNSLSFDKNSTTRLALFSSMITKDPHSFDINTDCGNLLVYAICYKLKIQYPENAEELNEVLYKAGIIRDEVSNYTLCSGVLAYKEGKEHKGWRGFYDLGEPLQVSLWNISKIEKVISPQGKVYVFENPTVFSEVLYKTNNKKPSMVCTFGNFKLASLIILDKLVESGAKIYYSGDFDPEGVMMADKLKQRYGENTVLWRYDEREYLTAKSSVKLSDSRLKKLDNVKSEELKFIARIIKESKHAAYQELLIDEYVEDIENRS
jgi:uncharacterized protein (TIGR02679 family)